MYYELYIDILFVVNFMMDYLLLLLVRRMLKCSATHGNICLGAATGSILTCIVIALPISYAFLKFLLFHVVVNTCMIYVGLRIKTIRSLIKAWILLYAGGFLLGGILESMQQYVTIGSLFLVVAIGGYYMALGIWNFISYIQRWNRYRCEVDLYLGEKRYKVQGIIDTGNHLRDPFTDQPVSVLDHRTAKQFFENEEVKEIRYIPYQSIGKQNGVLPAFQIDKMCVHREEECWIENPLIGVSEEMVSQKRTYEMILNPNLF